MSECGLARKYYCNIRAELGGERNRRKREGGVREGRERERERGRERETYVVQAGKHFEEY